MYYYMLFKLLLTPQKLFYLPKLVNIILTEDIKIHNFLSTLQ